MVFEELPDRASRTTEASEVQAAVGAITPARYNVVDLRWFTTNESVQRYEARCGSFFNLVLPSAVRRPFSQIIVGRSLSIPMRIEVSHEYRRKAFLHVFVESSFNTAAQVGDRVLPHFQVSEPLHVLVP